MGVYVKDGTQKLWWTFTDAHGTRHWNPSGFRVGQEKEAERAFELLCRAIHAERSLIKSEGTPTALPNKGLTLGMYGRHWHRQRLRDKPQAAKEDRWKLEKHIYPALEGILLAELRPRHMRTFVMELKAKRCEDGTPALASRSVRSIWSTLHSMLNDAVADELIATNPCVLKRGDLPPIEDADPDWRASAVYDRAEVEQLISDDRIPTWRRVLNALLFLAGFRPSEAFALRWKHYDAVLEPLGRLDLMRAFNTALRAEKALKVAGKRRLVPVHPTLARLLAEWKLSGWEAHVGRKPGADDLLVPNQKGVHLRVDNVYDDTLEDQAMLGWRKRRLYDSRRTFISLALADGANRDLLRWVTHGPRANEVMDLYTSIPWRELCGEVKKLRVSLLSGRIVELRLASGDQNRDSQRDDSQEGDANTMYFQSRHPDSDRGPTDYEAVPTRGTTRKIGENSLNSQATSPSGLPPKTRESGTTVTLSRSGPAVEAALRDAVIDWVRSQDVERLRGRLNSILAALEGGDR